MVGDDAPSIVLPATDGSTFDLSTYKGKRVILTFFRFDSCPFCNLRIHRLVKRWGEFPEHTVMVGIFDASISNLSKRMKKHKVPFTLVADETYEHFLSNGVRKSFLRVMLAPLRAPLTFLETLVKGYVPLTLSPAKLSTLPVDILIGADGKIVEAHYCKDTVDHMPIDKMVLFAQGN
ncbi:peroxiredoxin family protein [Euryarchaeota archaeon]|nr:peroxiredoxin family protein [Euryarchaeota archaeon]